MENNGARIYGMILSAFCSLMLGSAVLSAQAGVSLAGVGASFGQKVNDQIVTAGWAVPAPAEIPELKVNVVKTAASTSDQSDGFEAIVPKIRESGQKARLDATTAKMLELNDGQPVPMKAKVSKSEHEFKWIGVLDRPGPVRVVIMNQQGHTGTLYLLDAKGAFLKGYQLSSSAAPELVDASYPDFSLQKQFWLDTLGVGAFASLARGS